MPRKNGNKGHRELRSDGTSIKPMTRINDVYPTWLMRFLGLDDVVFVKWEYPKGRLIGFSKVSEKHIEGKRRAIENRKRGARRDFRQASERARTKGNRAS